MNIIVLTELFNDAHHYSVAICQLFMFSGIFCDQRIIKQCCSCLFDVARVTFYILHFTITTFGTCTADKKYFWYNLAQPLLYLLPCLIYPQRLCFLLRSWRMLRRRLVTRLIIRARRSFVTSSQRCQHQHMYLHACRSQKLKKKKIDGKTLNKINYKRNFFYSIILCIS